MQAIEANPIPLPAPAGLGGFVQSPTGKKLLAAIGAAAVMAIMAGVWMWSQKPEYKRAVLQLQRQGRRRHHRLAAADERALQVCRRRRRHPGAGRAGARRAPEAGRARPAQGRRRRLRTDGKPEAGRVASSTSRSTTSARSKASWRARSSRSPRCRARACTWRCRRPSVFVREQQKPTASVLLNLHPGRTLDQRPGQRHRPPGRLERARPAGQERHRGRPGRQPAVEQRQAGQRQHAGRDPAQVCAGTAAGHRRAASSPSSRRSSAPTTCAPKRLPMSTSRAGRAPPPRCTSRTAAGAAGDPQPADAAKRAGPGGAAPAGVPGALSNQPPANATAPINGQPAPAGAAAAPPHRAGSQRAQGRTTNYEVDKTIRYDAAARWAASSAAVGRGGGELPRPVMRKNGKTDDPAR